MLIELDYLKSKYKIKSHSALHIGASSGQEAHAYSKAGIDKVIWIEAIPDVFKQLENNIAKYPNHKAICACVSDTDGEKVKFNVANNEGQSSSMLEFGTHSKEHPTVKFTHSLEMTTQRIDSVLSAEDLIGYDFLNCDLQGAELLALKGMGQLLDGFKYVYIEVNERELYKGCPLLPEIDDFLLQFGFIRNELKVTNFGWGDAFYIKQEFIDLSNYHVSYLNLAHRKDRLEHMKVQLAKAGIKAVRTAGKLPSEYNLKDPKLAKMASRTVGAIPCHYGQVQIMQDALEQGKHAFVMEDDLVFCDDFSERLKIIEEFTANNDWDIMWLGGTYHRSPTWHKAGHPQLKECNCTLGKDWEPTTDNRIVRTYGCWSTYAYIVNKSSIEKILKLLEENVHKSIGIDWLMILLQPKLKTFAFVPGCVKQIDNQSDIGTGVTKFSGFAALGKHWWAPTMFRNY